MNVARILVDNGYALNIMLLTTLKDMGLGIGDLADNQLMIQGFNKGGEKALGRIYLTLTVGDWKFGVTFYVINSVTTYKMLLGRPWMHENGIVTSTLHQCLKFVKGGTTNTVWAEAKPFTEAESYLADAKFYLSKGIDIEGPIAKPELTEKATEAEKQWLTDIKWIRP